MNGNSILGIKRKHGVLRNNSAYMKFDIFGVITSSFSAGDIVRTHLEGWGKDNGGRDGERERWKLELHREV